MRLRSRLVAAALVVVAGITVASTGGSAAQGASASGYNFKLWGYVGMEVQWGVEQGAPSTTCTDWTKTVGYNGLEVAVPTESTGIPGHFQPVSRTGAGKQTTTWGPGTLNAVGRIPRRGTRSLRWVDVKGGHADCSPFVPPSNDCDPKGKLRRFTATLSIRAAHRGDLNTLADLVGDDEGAYPVIAVDGAPLKGLYDNCPVALRTPQVPANLAFEITRKEIKALKALKPGRRWIFQDKRALKCVAPDELPEGETCTANADVYINLRRVRPNERFP